MEIFAAPAQSVFTLLAITGVMFGLLALVTKRGRIVEAVRRCHREFMTNLGLTFINAVFLAPLFLVPDGWLRNAVGAPDALVAFWEDVPGLVTFAVAVLAFDFVVYWRHRLEHTRLFWPIHATHHADTAIHWLSILRKHPLSKLLSTLVDIMLLLLLGIPEWIVGIAGTVRGIWGFFIHADVPWTLGIFGKVLISPAAHRLHHIRDEALMGTNFGNTVTLWDKLFGTYLDPKPYLNCETGIAEGTRGLGGELWRPFERRYWGKAPAPAAETEATA
ncbi:sterol desaturase family protein [Qipengyuania sphaerica]|uniref:sterol desaturase family protein n=1 Tax=Qipengyuania sphaerica TaxID=2867243 RepID=UPI001C874B99|nr:sterol desaturase family protein [Qipengyuania sphaerica]MBX7540805.1 sterol desaturase family protein [Qipengyuania sphaerica]